MGVRKQKIFGLMMAAALVASGASAEEIDVETLVGLEDTNSVSNDVALVFGLGGASSMQVGGVLMWQKDTIANIINLGVDRRNNDNKFFKRNPYSLENKLLSLGKKVSGRHVYKAGTVVTALGLVSTGVGILIHRNSASKENEFKAGYERLTEMPKKIGDSH